MSAAFTHHGVTAWSVPAISGTPVLPTTLPGPALDLYVQSCRGQRVPLSFCLRADHSYAIDVVPPKSCPSCQPQVSVKHVALWIQNRSAKYGVKDPGLMPELLVNDPLFATVAADGLTNVVKSADADHLLPMILSANTTHQYWVTVTVPPGTEPGWHEMVIRIDRSCQPCLELPIVVDVLPFDLPPSPLEYSLYDKTCWNVSGMTEAKYTAQITDMLAHGVTSPIVWDDLEVAFTTGNTGSFAKLLAVRQACGLSVDPLYVGRIGVQYATPAMLPALVTRVRALKLFCAKRHIDTVYVLGRDEPDDAGMLAQRPIWEACRAEGVKIFAACSTRSASALQLVGDVLDLPMFNCVDAADPYAGIDTAAWHAKGARVFHYGATASENPAAYRRRYGLPMLRAGFDGACPYIYFERFGASATDDLDSSYKDHMLALTTDSGPIDTVQFWGLATGIDDTRFARALADIGGTVPDPAGRDLDSVRTEMIGRILLAR